MASGGKSSKDADYPDERCEDGSWHYFGQGVEGDQNELLGVSAPFLTTEGQPFLKVHHLYRLADDGPDAPGKVAALCPNCHRAARHAADRGEIVKKLFSIVNSKESCEYRILCDECS